MKTLHLSIIAGGIGGIIYAIVDYAYTISIPSSHWVSCKSGSSCPYAFRVFEFSSIEENFSIWLILSISIVLLCIGLIKVKKK